MKQDTETGNGVEHEAEERRTLTSRAEIDGLDWDIPGIHEFLLKHGDYTRGMVAAFEEFHEVELKGEALAYWKRAADGLTIGEDGVEFPEG
ncbi:hypothetical protein [Citricoccus nitrophenolicus]|uniref:hypothetical protein n=1 Tax=Citricoccus nitrophenolicus TaxID=863575 RepID=UPI0031ECE184